MFPRLFHIGSLNLPAYGALVAIGVIVGITISARLAERRSIDPEKAWNLGLLVVVAGIVGAKVLYILVDFNYYMQHPGEIFSLATFQAGGVFSGAVVAAFASSVWYIRRHHMPWLRTADCFAPGLALGHAIGRLGCFAAGCCYGKPTAHFWGVTFTNPLAHELVGTPLGVPLEPTQLFESAVELMNFFILYWLFGKKRQDGQVMGTYLFLYGVARFFLEFLRGDPGRGEVFGGAMSGTQLIAIGMVVTGGILWMKRSAAQAAPVRARARSTS